MWGGEGNKEKMTVEFKMEDMNGLEHYLIRKGKLNMSSFGGDEGSKVWNHKPEVHVSYLDKGGK